MSNPENGTSFFVFGIVFYLIQADQAESFYCTQSSNKREELLFLVTFDHLWQMLKYGHSSKARDALNK